MNRRFLFTALTLTCMAAPAIGQDYLPSGVFTESPLADSPFASPAACNYKVWGSAEYLLWFSRADNLATPLVTTTSNPFALDAAGNNVAAGIGVPGTSVLLGGSNINFNTSSGAKFIAGTWLDSDNTVGVEARGFFLANGAFERSFGSGMNGLPVIGIPVNSPFAISNPLLTVAKGENAVVESFPGTFAGSDTVISHTQLWGYEANGVVNLMRGCWGSVDLIVGFRYADLTDDISLIGQSSNTLPFASGGGVGFLNNFYDGTVTSVDSWRTRNQFYGGQLGVKGERDFGRFYVDFDAQVAMGANRQQLEVGGYSTLQTTTGQFATASGGTLNTQNNIGNFYRTQFSVLPEVELKLGYNFTPRIRGYIGYDVLCWTDVARAGDQTNRTVDLRQVPTLPIYDPTIKNTLGAPQIHNSTYWGQGLTFGFEFKF